MRSVAAVLFVGMTGALASPALAQTGDPANPTAPGPVPPALDAPWPPANSGCGEDGPTRSEKRPTVTLASPVLRLTRTGVLRIRLRGNQTAAMFVKVAQIGRKRMAGTERGSYTCTTPGNFTYSTRLSDYGRKIVRRHGELSARLRFRLINGSGVTHIRDWNSVIRPE